MTLAEVKAVLVARGVLEVETAAGWLPVGEWTPYGVGLHPGLVFGLVCDDAGEVVAVDDEPDEAALARVARWMPAAGAGVPCGRWPVR